MTPVELTSKQIYAAEKDLNSLLPICAKKLNLQHEI